ncbi:N-acetylmuramoyl-L-alanine amidase [Solibacillus sp. CAU 1738]|uniref:N-acetylmuramoyl-L-alanine amidase n=1 Tax=Solibacillus sp. CAU 1738 TaxID=3140363 RepID=UPI003260B1E8
MNISPGHWHVGTGAIGIIDEVTEARKVVSQVRKLLTEAGIDVRLVMDDTSTNQRDNLQYLIQEHHKKQQLNVSVHFNAVKEATNSSIGTEVLYKNDHMKQLALKISDVISNVSGLNNRGAKKRVDLAFLNALQDAILIEVCFVNSELDVALYKQHFHAICRAIAVELQNYCKPQLAISSPALLAKVEQILLSESMMRAAIEKGVHEDVFHRSWLARFEQKQLTPIDFLALCTLLATVK